MAFLALSADGQEKNVFLIFAEESCLDFSGLVAKRWSRGIQDGERVESFGRGGLMGGCLAVGDGMRLGSKHTLLVELWDGVGQSQSPAVANRRHDGKKPLEERKKLFRCLIPLSLSSNIDSFFSV